MVDEKTIGWYNTGAKEYAKLVHLTAPTERLQGFMALLPAGGDVLDLGCGPATASVHLREAGFNPDPVDAAQGMIDLANAQHDIGARLLTFDDLDAVAAYDGVWANFSLLHAPRDDLPRHLTAIATALRNGGVFHIGMKVGTGEDRDAIERKYTYVTVAELGKMLRDAGFTVLRTEEGAEKGCAGTVDPFVVMLARKI